MDMKVGRLMFSNSLMLFIYAQLDICHRRMQSCANAIIGDVLMGAFAGIFLAAPAFGVWRSLDFDNKYGSGSDTYESGSASLNEYLSCESVAVWKKIAAVLP